MYELRYAVIDTSICAIYIYENCKIMLYVPCMCVQHYMKYFIIAQLKMKYNLENTGLHTSTIAKANV